MFRRRPSVIRVSPVSGPIEQIQGWLAVTSAVHGALDGCIIAQLGHTGRASHPSVQEHGATPVGPSPIAVNGTTFTEEGLVPFVTPRPLETSEVAGVVEQYARGAENALRAGFDGVEIHGANGYLIDQFLHDSANQRSDEYGGSVENRCRFLVRGRGGRNRGRRSRQGRFAPVTQQRLQ